MVDVVEFWSLEAEHPAWGFGVTKIGVFMMKIGKRNTILQFISSFYQWTSSHVDLLHREIFCHRKPLSTQQRGIYTWSMEWKEELCANYYVNVRPWYTSCLVLVNQFINSKYKCSIYFWRPPSEAFNMEVSGNREAFLGCPNYPRIFSLFQKCCLRKELSKYVCGRAPSFCPKFFVQSY